MATLTDFLTGIANKLRTNLGTTGTINASEFGTKIDEVYNKAMSDFWDAFQQSGIRTNYEYSFSNTDFVYLRPKYKVVPTTRNVGVFESCRFLKKIESQYFDFSNATMSYGNYAMFRSCTNLIEIEDIKMQAGAYYQTFLDCQKLETIAKMRVNASCTFDGVFLRAYALKNITIEGTIAQNGLSFKDCPLLTGQSIDNIFAALDKSAPGTQKSITFSAANKTTANTYHNDSSFWDNRATLYTTYGWSISLI